MNLKYDYAKSKDSLRTKLIIRPFSSRLRPAQPPAET